MNGDDQHSGQSASPSTGGSSSSQSGGYSKDRKSFSGSIDTVDTTMKLKASNQQRLAENSDKHHLASPYSISPSSTASSTKNSLFDQDWSVSSPVSSKFGSSKMSTPKPSIDPSSPFKKGSIFYNETLASPPINSPEERTTNSPPIPPNVSDIRRSDFNKGLSRSISMTSSMHSIMESFNDVTPTPSVIDEEDLPTSLPKDIQLNFDATNPPTKDRLGQGRWAVVYKASYREVSKSQDLTCAVKMFDDLVTNEAQNNLHMEVGILLRLQNQPNILNFIGFQKAYEKIPPLLVIEYCELGSLWDFSFQNAHQIGCSLWCKWGQQLCEALQVLQKFGIIHHDIKPHNVLLTFELNAKLADFSNALFCPVLPDGSFGPLSDGIGRGTPSYTAPEIFTSPRVYSFPSDIYSLGATLYSLLSLTEPFACVRNPVHLIMWLKGHRGFLSHSALTQTAPDDSNFSSRRSSTDSSIFNSALPANRSSVGSRVQPLSSSYTMPILDPSSATGSPLHSPTRVGDRHMSMTPPRRVRSINSILGPDTDQNPIPMTFPNGEGESIMGEVVKIIHSMVKMKAESRPPLTSLIDMFTELEQKWAHTES